MGTSQMIDVDAEFNIRPPTFMQAYTRLLMAKRFPDPDICKACYDRNQMFFAIHKLKIVEMPCDRATKHRVVAGGSVDITQGSVGVDSGRLRNG